jgi:DNA-binding transcriptional ArsR family regulator
VDVFAVLSDPTRREILSRLQRAPCSVNELATELDISQPTMSKHLKVLRESGFLSCRVAAQQRIYQLERSPFDELGTWLEPFRRMWKQHLDELEQYLDRKEKKNEQERVPAQSRGTKQRHRAKRK